MQIEIFESISKLNKIDSINILDNSINQYLSLLLKGKLYKNDLIKIIDETITLLDKSIVKISHLKDDTVLIRSFKIHREIDCLVENYIAIKNAYNKLCVSMVDFKDKKHFLVCIMNGAIELPLILKMFIPNNIKGFGFFIDNRSYIERHCNPQATIKGHCLFNSDNLIILDDNIMTGKSIDNLIRFLGVTANYNAILVRHPNINRINQIRENGFCINMDELNKKAYGMTFDSPYTKIKPNTNYGNEYLDELGIFTLTGDLFLKLLYKNGHFLPNTEVSTFRL